MSPALDLRNGNMMKVAYIWHNKAKSALCVRGNALVYDKENGVSNGEKSNIHISLKERKI